MQITHVAVAALVNLWCILWM